MPRTDLRIPEAKRAAMFEYWCKIQDLSKTRREFGVGHGTIYRIYRRDNWQERYNKIQAEIRAAVDKKAQKAITSNLEYVSAIKKKLLAGFITRLNNGDIEAGINEILRVMEYEDKLAGNIESNEVNTNNTYNFNLGTDGDAVRDNVRALFASRAKRSRFIVSDN